MGAGGGDASGSDDDVGTGVACAGSTDAAANGLAVSGRPGISGPHPAASSATTPRKTHIAPTPIFAYRNISPSIVTRQSPPGGRRSAFRSPGPTNLDL